jgi:hypothetical protein
MDEGIQQFLATIIERCLCEHDMPPPFVVRSVGHNGSVLVVEFNEAAKVIVLTQRETDLFTLPISITIIGNDRTARFTIARDGNIGLLH